MNDKKLPDRWPEWSITEELGAGAYGRVYQAEKDDGEVCAFKIIHIPSSDVEIQAMRRDYPNDDSVRQYYSGIVKDFEREIDAMMQLKGHPNIVRIMSYDIDADEEHFSWTIFIQMEYLNTLNDYSIDHIFDEKMVIKLGIDMCNALEVCREEKIIHRDIKPDNIMVSDDGVFKLGDFGIARSIEKTTNTLSLRGTFTFMAPEVYHGEKYGTAVDLYSLGLVLYRFLNHMRDPFIDIEKQFVLYQDKEEALSKRMNGEKLLPPVEASDSMAEIILCACAYNPRERYATPGHMKAALENLLNDTYVKGSMMPVIEEEKEKKPGHFKRYVAAALVGCLLLSGGILAGEKLIKQRTNTSAADASESTAEEGSSGVVEQDSWGVTDLTLTDAVTETVKKFVEAADDDMWKSFASDDISIYNDSEAEEQVREQVTEEEFETAKSYYTPTPTNTDSNMSPQDRISELQEAYHEKSKRYIHIIGQEDDAYYVEVYRYYNDQETEKAEQEDVALQDSAYHGNLIQGSMIYQVGESDGELYVGSFISSYDYIHKYESAENPPVIVEEITNLLLTRIAPEGSTPLSAWLSDYGCFNFLWTEKDFFYDDCLRGVPVAYSVDEENNKIKFYLILRNDCEETMKMDNCSVSVSVSGKDVTEEMSCTPTKDWHIEPGECQYCTMEFSLADRKISKDDYLNSGVIVAISTDQSSVE